MSDIKNYALQKSLWERKGSNYFFINDKISSDSELSLAHIKVGQTSGSQAECTETVQSASKAN